MYALIGGTRNVGLPKATILDLGMGFGFQNIDEHGGDQVYVDPIEHIRYNYKQPGYKRDDNRPDKFRQRAGDISYNKPWIDYEGPERKPDDSNERYLINDASHDWDDVFGDAFAMGDGMVDNSRYRWAGSKYGYADRFAERLDGTNSTFFSVSNADKDAKKTYYTPSLRSNIFKQPEVRFKLHTESKASDVMSNAGFASATTQYDDWKLQDSSGNENATVANDPFPELPPMRAYMNEANQKRYWKMIQFFTTRKGKSDKATLNEQRMAISELKLFRNLEPALQDEEQEFSHPENKGEVVKAGFGQRLA